MKSRVDVITSKTCLTQSAHQTCFSHPAVYLMETKTIMYSLMKLGHSVKLKSAQNPTQILSRLRLFRCVIPVEPRVSA